jgi:hypothetical protein
MCYQEKWGGGGVLLVIKHFEGDWYTILPLSEFSFELILQV